jgi:predicted transcriptional regulator
VAFIAITLERMMRQGTSVTTDRLQVAAEALRATEANEPDDIYATLKARLLNTHGIRIKRRTIEEMTQALRVYDKENRVIYLSGALDYSNGLPTRSCGVPD